MRELRLILGVIAVFGLCVTASPASAREPLDIGVFAKIGPPGQPEPIAVGADGLVYVGTNQLGHGDADAPSKIFAFSAAGTLVREYTIQGQPLTDDHGIQGLAFDGDGLLYALDRSADPRVVVLDPATGEQRRYASFRDVPSCSAAAGGDCSETVLDRPSGPDYGVFSPSGELYVTDIDQALIWRVPRGGGRAEIWFKDRRLESLYGPNGIQFMADGRTLLFANTASNPSAGNPTTGRLYTVRVEADGSPGELTQVWESLPLDAPDGFAIAQSGNIYLALAGTNQVVLLSPAFAALARVPANPLANLLEEIPLDGPASAAFLGDRVLVSNHSPILGNPSSWAVLDVFAGEVGLPLHYPRIFDRGLPLGNQGRSRPKLRIKAKPARSATGDRLLRVRVTSLLDAGRTPIAGALVRALDERTRTNARGSATVRLPQHPKRPIVVAARKRGFEKAVLVWRAS